MTPRPVSRLLSALHALAVPPAQPSHRDVSYATISASQVLDLYLPTAASTPPPLIVNIHGGAFKEGDKAAAARLITTQLKAGYAAASLNYRLSGEAVFPAAVKDVKAAIRWLRAQASRFGYDPDRFVVWGESAGGYLAQMVALTGDQRTEFDAPELGNPEASAAVQAAVIWYGPNDFAAMDRQFAEAPPTSGVSPQQHDPPDSPESLFLGVAVPDAPDLVRRANPLTYLSSAKNLPPFTIAAGDQDHLVPHQQSIELADALRAAGSHAELSIVRGLGHGSAIDEAQLRPALQFLSSHLA